MFITSAAQASDSGQLTRLDDGSTQYWLVSADTCGATGGMVGLLEVPPTTEHTVLTGPVESASLVVSGTVELTDGAAAPVRLETGTVVQNEPVGRYTVRTAQEAAQLLTYYGGATRWSDAPYSADHAEPVPGAVARQFKFTDAEDNPFHLPEMGFLHMSARWLIDASNGASSSFTFGQSTFAPNEGCHELHRHPNAEEVFYVWAGEGVHLTEGGGEIPMREGDLVFVPRNEWHGFRNTGSTPLRAVFGYLGANSLETGGYELPPPSTD